MPARTEQSPPRQPPRHSHAPRMQMPWPEHMLRSRHAFMGCTVPETQALQQVAGAMGTNSASNVSLR